VKLRIAKALTREKTEITADCLGRFEEGSGHCESLDGHAALLEKRGGARAALRYLRAGPNIRPKLRKITCFLFGVKPKIEAHVS
jgi:hypothetical protein